MQENGGRRIRYLRISLAIKRVLFAHARGLLPPLSRSPLLPEEGSKNPASHKNALDAMKMCQIKVVDE